MEDFERFWKAYPARNGRKTNKWGCKLWFEAKKPDRDTVDAMIKYLETYKANAKHYEYKKEFYAPLKDPERFLKNKMWEDDIENMTPKPRKKATCFICPKPATMYSGGRGYCGSDHYNQGLRIK